MAIHYRTRGFILLKDDLREADQLFNIYTKNFGKLKILARAIRKIKSKLRSGIELFYLSEIEFIQGRNYKTLTDAIAIDKFKNIRNDLSKLEIAYKVAELTDTLIHGQEKDKEIWNLLNEVFNRLNNWNIENLLKIENWKLKIIYYYFLWNLLMFLGFQIDLYNCVICRKKLIPENLYFSAEKGGIICSRCLNQSLQDISPEIIKILRIIIQKDWNMFLKLKISKTYKKELESVSENYLSYIKSIQS